VSKIFIVEFIHRIEALAFLLNIFLAFFFFLFTRSVALKVEIGFREKAKLFAQKSIPLSNFR